MTDVRSEYPDVDGNDVKDRNHAPRFRRIRETDVRADGKTHDGRYPPPRRRMISRTAFATRVGNVGNSLSTGDDDHTAPGKRLSRERRPHVSDGFSSGIPVARINRVRTIRFTAGSVTLRYRRIRWFFFLTRHVALTAPYDICFRRAVFIFSHKTRVYVSYEIRHKTN